MLPLTEGEDGRHGLAGPKTAVMLGAKNRERPGRLARMCTAQAAARARTSLLRDSGETPNPVAEKVGLAADGVYPCAARHPGGQCPSASRLAQWAESPRREGPRRKGPPRS